MKFSVMDDKVWKKYMGVRLYTCFPVRDVGDGFPHKERVRETKNKYLLVKYFGGMLTLGCAERFDDLRNNMSLVARETEESVRGKLAFEDIKNFMQWQIRDDEWVD